MPSPVLLNASDAKRLSIRQGDTVLISTAMGQVLRPARVTHTIKPGVISLPHGRWANIDEKTGIDPAGADNVLYEQVARSEEHTSELQSLMRISYAVFCLKKKKNNTTSSCQN